MKHNTDTLWVVMTGGTISSAAYLFGGIDKLLIAFVILMSLDYITGIMAAFYDKKVSSKTAFKGLMKKGAMFSLIIVATQLDIILGNQGLFIRYAILMFLIGTEGISLVENLGRLDVKVPKVLSNAFIQLKDKNNENEKGEDQ
ncbi:MAG: phage holin family protein [Bacillus sp. (in: firmicutes)]